jgi:hypothetical protein
MKKRLMSTLSKVCIWCRRIIGIIGLIGPTRFNHASVIPIGRLCRECGEQADRRVMRDPCPGFGHGGVESPRIPCV